MGPRRKGKCYVACLTLFSYGDQVGWRGFVKNPFVIEEQPSDRASMGARLYLYIPFTR